MSRDRTFELGVGVAGGVEGGPEQEADGGQEHVVERVPEVADDPVIAPLLVVLVRHLHQSRQWSGGVRAGVAFCTPSVLSAPLRAWGSNKRQPKALCVLWMTVSSPQCIYQKIAPDPASLP